MNIIFLPSICDYITSQETNKQEAVNLCIVIDGVKMRHKVR